MLQIETKEIKISDELKRKIEMIGRFTNTKPIIKNGSIRNITLSSITNQELLSKKDELRDFIIKTIEESSDKKIGRIISLIFRATSKIEEVFEQNELFYQNTRDFYNWEYDKKEYANKNYYHPISELDIEFIKERDEERIKNSNTKY